MSADGTRQLGHVGGVHLQLLAEKTGLAEALTRAMRRPGFRPAHARGQVLVDLACAIVLGAVAIGDIAVLEHQRGVLGPVASAATAWRTLDEVGELQQRRIAVARAAVRRRAWKLLEERPEGFPWTVVDGRPLAGWTVLDSDATPVPCASEKEGAAGTYKKGVFGLCPLLVYCDNTGEMLAHQLRPGDAGCNDTADNIEIFRQAVEQLPGPYRRKVLFRTDRAGFSCGLLKWIADCGGRVHPSYRWEYSTGWSFTGREMDAVLAVDALEDRTSRVLWEPALEADGTVREKAFVVEITGLLGDLDTWPKGHRVFVRREPLHPRYAKDASAYEREHGVRLTAFATNTPGRQAAWLDLRHRGHCRVEPKIRDSKAESLARFPSRFMKINQAWLTATALACDLRNWLQLLGCQGAMARATPKTLRYRFLHVPAVLVRGQRRRRLKIPATWPWAEQIVEAFRRIRALPAPT
ncbi:IS1380 family transposase [Streptomyces sp. NPDC051976]|uniref:IS1380 family transposase n=1 Tax=Streptomyces sp. NPDC051976 TaxID=3154947 RepID=UPI00344AD043